MEFLKVYGKDDLLSFPTGVWGIKEPGPLWQGSERQKGMLSTISVEHFIHFFRSALNKDSDALDIILLPGQSHRSRSPPC